MTRYLICLSFTAIVALASAVSAGTYSGGDGSAADPYQISTPADMNEIGANSDDWNKHFLLANDIDLSAFSGTEFNIIGTKNTPFTGAFDGADHTISNFTYTATDASYIGLFGYADSSHGLYPVIKDLTLVVPDVNIAGYSSYGGSLVGYLEFGTITGCGIEGGSVTGNGSTGGLVGGNSSTISNSYVTGSVTGDYYTGGLVGANYGTISNCHTTGSVTGDQFTGGVVGWNRDNNSTWWIKEGVIKNCYAAGSVLGDKDTGGLVGENWGGTIENCYAAGSVTGNSSTGGLVGSNYNEGTIWASFWDVEIGGPDNGIGTGLPTSQMQTESTFTDAGWDFVDIWDICEGTNYPKLVWQIPAGDFLCPDGVNFIDYSFFAGHWLDDNCGGSNDCDGTDLDQSGTVDFSDIEIFADNWLEGQIN